MSRQDLKALVLKKYSQHGDALVGERIIAQAREISKPAVVPGTSVHRIQETILKTNAMCVIDRPFKLSQPVMKLKTQ